MHFEKVFKTEDGTWQFQGDFTEEEVRFFVEVAVSYLMRQGAIPLKAFDDADISSFVPPTETEQ